MSESVPAEVPTEGKEQRSSSVEMSEVKGLEDAARAGSPVSEEKKLSSHKRSLSWGGAFSRSLFGLRSKSKGDEFKENEGEQNGVAVVPEPIGEQEATQEDGQESPIKPSRLQFGWSKKTMSPEKKPEAPAERHPPHPHTPIEHKPGAALSHEPLVQLLKDVEGIEALVPRKQGKLLETLKASEKKLRELEAALLDPHETSRKLRSSLDVLKAAVQAAEDKNGKISRLGLVMLQRLAVLDAIDPPYFAAVGMVLRKCSEVAEEAIQLRVVQFISSAMQSERFAIQIGPALFMLEALLSIHGGRFPAASQAAAAALRQVTEASIDLLHKFDLERIER